MRQWSRLGSFVMLVSAMLSFLAVGKPVSHAADVTPAATPTSAATAPRVGVTRTPSARSLDRIWWNQPTFVKALRLTDEQREKMDEILLRALDAQPVIQTQLEAKRRSFEEALAKGDWQAARKAAAELHDGMANIWGIQSGLTIDVLSLFSPQQRQDFISKYPQLLRRPWMLTMGGRGARLRSPGPRSEK